MKRKKRNVLKKHRKEKIKHKMYLRKEKVQKKMQKQKRITEENRAKTERKHAGQHKVKKLLLP